ncbi:acyltransferase domain-containing protein [Streptomyces corynorhini]|uniref:Acyltransferase domain-containing protein n=1 Tax=Streptomyces corynorhini TaxID=2282652 RepID=A0A370BAU5_9ACTN|nr:acyltransferase domain-containing protein [Streptomyces corynorhini]
MIVEETPREPAPDLAEGAEGAPALPGGVPLPLSARGADALRGQAARLRDFLTERPTVRLHDVALSLATTRSALEHRAVLAVPDRAAALAALTALADGTGTEARGVADSTAPPVLLAFPAADPDWTAALAPLAGCAPVFADALTACGHALTGLVDWTPADVLAGRTAPDWRQRPEIAVPLGWAVAVAAAALLRSWGVEPAAVTGRGTGEIAAARVAGLLDPATAARLAVHLGRTPADGFPPVVFGPAEVPFWSASTGSWLDTEDEKDGPRWADALVAGSAAGSAAGSDVAPGAGSDPLTLPDGGRTTVVRVGASPAGERAALDPADPVVERPGAADGPEPLALTGPDGADLTGLLAHLHVRGVPVDWAAVLAPAGARTVPLPTYGFRRRHYWMTAEPRTLPATDADRPADGWPLLDSVVELPDSGGLLLTGTLTPRTAAAWGADGSGAVPGSALLELALHAGDHVGCDLVAELTAQTTLVVPENEEVLLRVTVGEPDESGERVLRVSSRPARGLPGTPWTRHAHALLRPVAGPPAFDLDVWPPADAERVDPTALPAPGSGGPRALWRRGDDLYAEVALESGQRTADPRHVLHPALLDTALRVLGDPDTPREPASWHEVALYAEGATALRIRLTRTGADTVALAVGDDTGLAVAAAAEVRLRPADPARLIAARTALHGPLLHLEWARVSCEAPGGKPRWALVGPDPRGVRAALMKAGIYTEAYDTLEALAKALDAGTEPPATVLSVVPAGPDDVTRAAAAAVEAVGHATALAARWLSDERFAAARLVFVTHGSVAHGPAAPSPLTGGPVVTGGRGGTAPDPVTAAVWGTVRSAQNADPGRR